MQYAKLRRPASAPHRDLEGTLHRLASDLSDFEGTGSLRVVVRCGDRRMTAGLKVTKAGCSVTKGASKGTDIEVIVREAEWEEICMGELSPLEAIGRGGLRFRGNQDLAVAMLRHLSGNQGIVEPCLHEEGS